MPEAEITKVQPIIDVSPDPIALSTASPTPQPSQISTLNQLTATSTKKSDIPNIWFNENCGNTPVNMISLSPNGNWQAISCGYNHDQTLKIIGQGGTQWTLKYKDFLAQGQIADGIPIGGIYPVHWGGEDYLFFSPSIGYSGGGVCRYIRTGQSLHRINLNTGYVSVILAPLTGARGYDVAFSRNGRMLAYINVNSLAILDMKTGEVIRFEIGDGSSGDLTWSPDGSELAFATCETTDDNPDLIKSKLKLISRDMRRSKTILEVSGAPLHIFSAGTTDLIIVDSEYENEGQNYWFYNWPSGQLVITTLTPTP